ncbi:MAG: carbon-nitrogen hydrolase family protein, partial [Planctomycetota bacterium]
MAKLLRVSICALDIRHTTPRSAFNLDDNLRAARQLLSRAADQGADLAVLPEVCAVQNHACSPDAAETLDGPVLSALADAARSLSIGVAAGHITLENDRRYNSLLLFNRSGRLIADYHKMFPTIWELEKGISPGTGPLVLDTPFGRLGFALCYDLNFAELRLAYRDLHPELILFASAFRGGLQTNSWAYETRSYFLSSVIDPKSVIVNPLGRTIADTG